LLDGRAVRDSYHQLGLELTERHGLCIPSSESGLGHGRRTISQYEILEKPGEAGWV